MDEGYIKFNAHWTQSLSYSRQELAELDRWRQRMYEAGLIGAYDNGIGFGNISCRTEPGGSAFYITGSATGNVARLGAEHYSKVIRSSAASNELWCEGPIVASSESMSHAAVYGVLPDIQAVIHVHHRGMWEALLHRIPTTPADAPYGSPEMVAGIQHLLRTSDLPHIRFFAMAGHEEGLFSFGQTLEEAGTRLLQALHHWEAGVEDGKRG